MIEEPLLERAPHPSQLYTAQRCLETLFLKNTFFFGLWYLADAVDSFGVFVIDTVNVAGYETNNASITRAMTIALTALGVYALFFSVVDLCKFTGDAKAARALKAPALRNLSLLRIAFVIASIGLTIASTLASADNLRGRYGAAIQIYKATQIPEYISLALNFTVDAWLVIQINRVRRQFLENTLSDDDTVHAAELLLNPNLDPKCQKLARLAVSWRIGENSANLWAVMDRLESSRPLTAPIVTSVIKNSVRQNLTLQYRIDVIYLIFNGVEDFIFVFLKYRAQAINSFALAWLYFSISGLYVPLTISQKMLEWRQRLSLKLN